MQGLLPVSIALIVYGLKFFWDLLSDKNLDIILYHTIKGLFYYAVSHLLMLIGMVLLVVYFGCSEFTNN